MATARILSERRFVRATAPHTPPPGPTATHRTERPAEEEDAEIVTALLARSVPLGSLGALRLDSLSRVKT